MYDKEFNIASKAIKYVGKHILKKNAVSKTEKGNFDYFTDKDIESETYLINKIKQHFPSDNFLTEENNSNNQLLDRTWVIDPIDGTHNFMNNLPIFCVQLAFFAKGEAQFSIIYLPRQNEFYYAKKGQGAYLDKQLLKINPNLDEKSILVNADFLKSKELMQLNFDIMLKIRENCVSFRDIGSYGCECAYLACGYYGVFFLVNHIIKPWDSMPGELLCKEAGAISKFEVYKDINYHVIAINEKLCDKMEKIIKECIDKKIHK